jgi:ubiquinone/menaquinone biosynthesis C-methylase UbiE
MYKILRKVKNQILKLFGLQVSNSNQTINKSEYWQNKKRAKIYHSQTSKPDYNVEMNKIFVDHVESYLTKNSNVLDIGAGTGVVSLEMARRGYSVTASDISKQMLEHISESNNNIKIIQGDIFSLKSDHLFDCVISRWFIPHFRNWPTLISHVTNNLLNNSGYLIFDMPQEEHILNSRKLKYELSPEVFGYDHSGNATDNYFYAMASINKLEEIAKINNLKLVARIPHGLLKSNLILGNSIGELNFKKFNDYLLKIGKENDGREFLYNLEKYLSTKIENHLTHGSIIIFKKND